MQRNPLSQLATLGEEVIGKAAQNPTAARVLQAALEAKERLDELSRRVRGLEAMEKRLAELERRVDKLDRRPKRPAGAAKKKSSAKKTSAAGPPAAE